MSDPIVRTRDRVGLRYPFDWMGPKEKCPAYRLQASCDTLFCDWSCPVHDLTGEEPDPRSAMVVEYFPPMTSDEPKDWSLTKCEWIVPGLFTW